MLMILFQGGFRDEALLIELVTLVGLEGLLARCGGLDGQLDQVTNFGFLICTIDNQCRVAIQQKVWTWTKILIPNIRYFVAISRFVALFKAFLRKNCFCCDFGSTHKNNVFCRELTNTRLTKELKAFFAFAESLPTSATLNK